MVYEVGNFNPPFANPEAVALQGQAQWKAPERHTAGFESDPADWQQSPLLLPYNLKAFLELKLRIPFWRWFMCVLRRLRYMRWVGGEESAWQS